MTIKKDVPVQQLAQNIDQAVDAAMGDDPIYRDIQKLGAARSMTPSKAKKKARDKARKRVTFDWPEWLIERLEAMAQQLGCPVNQLAAVVAVEGLRAVEQGDLDLEGRIIPSRTPIYSNFLRVDEEGDL